MAKVYASAIIATPVGTVWALVRDFNALPQWTGFVVESRIEHSKSPDQIGCIRNFRLRDGFDACAEIPTIPGLIYEH